MTKINGAAIDASNGSTSAQISTLLANLSKYTRMLHLLDSAAPADISVDMHQAVAAWDSQSAALSKLASNPLEGLASELVTSVFASSYDQAVDTYAAAHCGQQVFGSVHSTQTTLPAAGSNPSGGTYSSAAVPFTASGWNYAYKPALNGIVIAFTKDISHSQPGYAQLKITITLPKGFPGTIEGTDAGRNPPQLSFGKQTIVWYVPGEDKLPGIDNHHFTAEFDAQLSQNPVVWEDAGGDEASIDKLVTDMQSARPIDIGMPISNNYFFIDVGTLDARNDGSTITVEPYDKTSTASSTTAATTTTIPPTTTSQQQGDIALLTQLYTDQVQQVQALFKKQASDPIGAYTDYVNYLRLHSHPDYIGPACGPAAAEIAGFSLPDSDPNKNYLSVMEADFSTIQPTPPGWTFTIDTPPTKVYYPRGRIYSLDILYTRQDRSGAKITVHAAVLDGVAYWFVC